MSRSTMISVSWSSTSQCVTVASRPATRRRRVAGLLATVTHWDVEDHEVEIVLDHDIVRDVQAHVRRSRLMEPATV